MSKLGNILINVFTKNKWFNSSEYCNRKTHPESIISYRKYRRGKHRCNYCGGKIGKVKCKRDNYRNRLLDNIYNENPLFKAFSNKAEVGRLER